MKVIDKTLIIGINAYDYGSTGNIMRNTLEYASDNGDYDFLVVVPHDKGNRSTYSYKDKPLNIFQKIWFHKILKEQNRPEGFRETPYTNRVINKIKVESRKYKCCFVCLHNIHGANIDIRLLFNHLNLNKNVSKVFYTLHDEWPYTGECFYACCFHCDKWKTGCPYHCPQNLGQANFDVNKQFSLKKAYTEKLANKLTLITVSNWLSNNVFSSFLKNFETKVIYGETSLDPLNIDENEIKRIKESLGIDNKKIVLSVSAYWNEWKGTNYLFKIADKLPDDYVLLVIGGKIEPHKKIIHLKNVKQIDLTNYYCLADVYLSVSQAETLGLTTCEAQLCGTPVVAFGHTAVKETIINGKTGYIVGEDNDVDKMIESIIEVVEHKPFKKEDIILNGQRFQKNEHAKRMFDLFERSKG